MIKLIYEIYDLNYFEDQFYDINVIKCYIKKIRNMGGAWKGAFFKGNLIGQMLAVIENQMVILKLTMLKQEFRKFGIMTLLSISMIDEIKNYKDTDFHSIFAFIDSHNSSIIEILRKFKFIEVGTIPFYNNETKILIFSKVVFDNKLILITPHLFFIDEIKASLEKLGLKRIVIRRTFNYPYNSNILVKNIKIEKNSNKNPTKYFLIVDNIVVAEFLENKQQNSWYNFNFNGILSYKIKYSILKEILSFFNKSPEVKSISLIVNINDVDLQDLMIRFDIKYLGYLPYYGKNDGILFGISKGK
ncbi:MAG: hypothetical protein JW891_08520 [Candidatus Lokiarchaeota archaeon]|nr:hypothetical protein [Candidatus Lokiarchaeota archaeon]